jgi:hypothetical protein
MSVPSGVLDCLAWEASSRSRHLTTAFTADAFPTGGVAKSTPRVGRDGGSLRGLGGPGLDGLGRLLVVRLRPRQAAAAGRRTCADPGYPGPEPVGAGVLRAVGTGGAFAPFAAEPMWVFAFPLARMVFVWFFAEEDQQPG